MKFRPEILAAMQAAGEDALRNRQGDSCYGVREGDGPIAAWPSQPVRILFLDFDGVLNSEKSNDALGTRYKFSKGSVAVLNLVLEKTDARIVISSSWRNHWTLRENAQFLERDGVMPGRVIGKTPTLEKERGYEIEAWLKTAPFGVSAFVILDDRDDMAMHSARLVRVDPQVGLTVAQGARAMGILNE